MKFVIAIDSIDSIVRNKKRRIEILKVRKPFDLSENKKALHIFIINSRAYKRKNHTTNPTTNSQTQITTKNNKQQKKTTKNNEKKQHPYAH